MSEEKSGPIEEPATESSSISSERSRENGSRNRKRILIPLVIVLVAAAVLVWFFLLRGNNGPSNVIEVSGRIESDDSAVAVKTSGRVREINVREGDSVKAGQVIAILDDEQAAAREEQARAAVQQAEARARRAEQQIAVLEEQINQSNISVEQAREDARGRVTQAEGQVAAAESQLAQAEANYRQAQYDAEKFTRLLRSGDVPERQTRQAQTTLQAQANVVRAQRKQVDAARGALTAARANLANPRIRSSQTAALQRQVGQAQSDIESANADAERARAQLREVAANRADLSVVAPFDGTVATRAVEPGEVVAPGTTIITLVDLNALYLRAFVPEGDIGNVKLGQAARVFLDSAPNQPFDAEVSRIDPEATFTPENTYFRNERVKQVVGVKLIIKDPQGLAKPGMPADGEILISGNWASQGRTN